MRNNLIKVPWSFEEKKDILVPEVSGPAWEEPPSGQAQGPSLYSRRAKCLITDKRFSLESLSLFTCIFINRSNSKTFSMALWQLLKLKMQLLSRRHFMPFMPNRKNKRENQLTLESDTKEHVVDGEIIVGFIKTLYSNDIFKVTVSRYV